MRRWPGRILDFALLERAVEVKSFGGLVDLGLGVEEAVGGV